MEGTMELWKADVTDRIDNRGTYVLFSSGTLVLIDGEEFVRDTWDIVTRRNSSWHTSKAAATEEAAARVDELANILLKQAQELREAAHASA